MPHTLLDMFDGDECEGQRKGQHLHELPLVHLLVNGAGCEEPVDGAGLGLAVPPDARHCLPQIA